MTPPKKNGKQTVWFETQPVILSTATIVGSKEGEGPLGDTFDKVINDNYYGEKSWERAEQRMLEEVMESAVQKANLKASDIDFMLAGDLLNQIISADYTARNMGIPFLGLYGACSTMYEGMAIGAMLIDGGYADYVLIGVSSHYGTAERQFRAPVEHGVQRPMSSQWTVTGAAAVLLARQGQGPVITHATIGKAVDLGEGNAGDMGSVMAPAAADTIMRHLQDTNRSPGYYDVYLTGDLGKYGKELALKLLHQKAIDISANYEDCGCLIYAEEQDVHAGGSGCACSGVVTAGYVVQHLNLGKIKRVLGVGTGALFSPVSSQQGETIPGIGHAVVIESRS